MNVEDFPPKFDKQHLDDIWEIIFSKQHHLASKYIPIEIKNELRWVPDMRVDLDSGKGQAQLKDMAWRCIEEIGESMEALLDVRGLKEQLFHAQEELADGLHFLVELGILAGFSSDDVRANIKSFDKLQKYISSQVIEESITNFVMYLGITMNCLKNKPWKQSQYPTDIEKFKKLYLEAFQSYIMIMLQIMEPLDILNLYFSKSQVNEFRQRSNY